MIFELLIKLTDNIFIIVGQKRYFNAVFSITVRPVDYNHKSGGVIMTANESKNTQKIRILEWNINLRAKDTLCA